MRLRYSASVFGGITQLLFILSLGAFTSASPIDTSAMSESSPNPLIERTRTSEQRKCSTIFGKPSYSDCKAAIGQIGQISDPRQFYVNPQDQSNQLPNTYLPLGHISGGCVAWVTTMSIIKAGHFGFIVGDTPVGTTDTSTWAAIRGVAEQLNTNCASSIPPGQSLGGIQRAGANLDLAVIVFGEGLFHQYLSTMYGRNILLAPQEHAASSGQASS